MRRILLWAAVTFVVVFGLAQLVPYGRAHGNPAVVREPRWDTPRTRELAAGACFDCHSNLTTWPWYSKIAPVSWLTQSDVEGGREILNFSDWTRPQADAGEVEEVVSGGEMPPWYYKLPHPASRLSSSERDALARGLRATYAQDPPG